MRGKFKYLVLTSVENLGKIRRRKSILTYSIQAIPRSKANRSVLASNKGTTFRWPWRAWRRTWEELACGERSGADRKIMRGIFTLKKSAHNPPHPHFYRTYCGGTWNGPKTHAYKPPTWLQLFSRGVRYSVRDCTAFAHACHCEHLLPGYCPKTHTNTGKKRWSNNN